MTLQLRPDDPRLSWHGHSSLEVTDDGVLAWRIPHERKGLFPVPALWERASMAAGVRIAFCSNTTRVAGALAAQDDIAPIDLCVDGRLVDSIDLTGRDRFEFDDLPADEKQIELWLPQRGHCRLQGLELSDGATVAPFADTRPRWIHYGSSISQCAAAESPTQTWPAIVARQRGLNLRCLGLGGQCHLDAMIARLIRDEPADFLSLCVGINIHGGGTLNERTFRSAVIGFVQIVREKHPDTPLALMSPIFCAPREHTPNLVGFTLAAMREEVAAAVEALREHGDEHVHYVHGLDVFDRDLEHLLPDDLHPNAEGYKIMGANFAQLVAKKHFTNAKDS